ncbi:MAG: conserved hypothetical protein [Leptospirillum rubarum]|jgi:hypothetical protein|nr:MAG: conserved hypothetical protein [Leptospirillum rubarum]
MKLLESLKELGRVVAYYPSLARALKDVKAAIFLVQLIYWTPRTRQEAEGWIYKTSGEIEMETGLVYEEQLTARKKLVRLGVLEEHYARLEHRLYFRVKEAELDSLWERFIMTPPSPFGESPIPEMEKVQIGK